LLIFSGLFGVAVVTHVDAQPKKAAAAKKKPAKKKADPPPSEETSGGEEAAGAGAGAGRAVAGADEATAKPKGKGAGPEVVEEKTEGDAGIKTYRFGAVEVEGRLKSPQVLYFMRRVRAEFAAGELGHRSFLRELSDTRRHRALK
jgi:hypothetical protein